jgi:hypothetical protein
MATHYKVYVREQSGSETSGGVYATRREAEEARRANLNQYDAAGKLICYGAAGARIVEEATPEGYYVSNGYLCRADPA